MSQRKGKEIFDKYESVFHSKHVVEEALFLNIAQWQCLFEVEFYAQSILFNTLCSVLKCQRWLPSKCLYSTTQNSWIPADEHWLLTHKYPEPGLFWPWLIFLEATNQVFKQTSADQALTETSE